MFPFSATTIQHSSRYVGCFGKAAPGVRMWKFHSVFHENRLNGRDSRDVSMGNGESALETYDISTSSQPPFCNVYMYPENVCLGTLLLSRESATLSLSLSPSCPFIS